MQRSGTSSCAPRALCFAASLLLANGVSAQVAWQRMRFPEHTHSPLIAFDTARQRSVMYDAYLRRMWEYDGAQWTERTPAAAPPQRERTAMVFDEARRRVVMFGGITTPASNETWEWDGSTWLLRTPPTSPPARGWHAMGYDSARQRVVMFGGRNATVLADTWEWDGSTWLQRMPLTVPPPRSSPAMTYDSVRQRVVMFGGQGQLSIASLGDTWEWDGADWQAQPGGPPGRSQHAMAYDPLRQRTVVFGGGAWQSISFNYFFLPRDDTWEWNGTIWTQGAPATVPPAMMDHPLVFDANRQRVVLHGGTVQSNEFVRQWEWDGTDWSSPPLAPPFPQDLAFDSTRGRTVMLVQDETWEWDGGTWRFVPTTIAPPPRLGHGTAFDAARQQVVVFGGRLGSASLGDTWTWDGATWTPHAVPGPSPRWRHAMAYDPLRQRTVLFAGESSSGTLLADTWEWDGQSWTQVTPPAGPGPKSKHTMAWDPLSQRVLLFGVQQDTWTWNGTAWTQVYPPAFTWALAVEMAHDHGRNRLVLTMTENNLVPWWLEWNGAAWTSFPGAPGAVPIAGDALGRVVSSSWILTSAARATAQPSGLACAGGGAAPILGSSDPYFGNEAFALEVLDAQANAVCAFGWASGTASLPLGAGCTVLVNTPFALELAAANAAGVARTAAFTIPAIAVLAGAQLHAQALVLDPQAPLGFTMTARRTLLLGP